MQNSAHDSKGARYVLLVGAVEPNGAQADAEKKVLPALKGTLSRMKDQPTDHAYGRPDDDGIPTCHWSVGCRAQRRGSPANGRQDARPGARDKQPGERRRRLTILAGAPEFNPFVDRLVDQLTMAKFDQLDPPGPAGASFQ